MPDKEKEIPAMRAINPMIIMAVILVIAAIATYIIPAGVFDRIPNEATGYDMIAIDSYHHVEQNPVGPFQFFMSFSLGLQAAAPIIVFLLIIGGMFRVVDSTGALNTGLSNLVVRLKGRETLLVPACVFIFGLVSATAACCEEYLAFLPLMYVVCVAIGFDSVTAVALLFCSSAVGYASGFANAFTVGIGQSIAGLPLFSGMPLRIGIYLILATVTSLYLLHYARTIKNHPEKNTMRETDLLYSEKLDLEDVPPMTTQHRLILLVFGGGFVAIAFCVIKFGFYVDEMTAIFLIMALLTAIIAKMSPGEFCDQFTEGCKDLLGASLIIGMCNTVTVILTDANVMDTLIYGAGQLLSGLPHSVSACGMFIVQDLLNCLIPSGSGQAAVTMPFMAPLSDLLGVTRQTSVLAFQLGDAYTNVITPTSGELMAALAICHVPYKKWFKFMGPLWAIWIVCAFAFLIFAVSIGYA